MPEDSKGEVEQCSYCLEWYEGYHRCDEGPDRVEFTCSTCDDHIDRERHRMDVKGVPPSRCASCVMELMSA